MERKRGRQGNEKENLEGCEREEGRLKEEEGQGQRRGGQAVNREREGRPVYRELWRPVLEFLNNLRGLGTE